MIFTYDGHRIYYSDEGKGEVLLFISGLAGSGLNWIYQRQHFSKRMRVICIDLPGHGRSEGRSIPFVEFPRVVERLLSHLRLRSCIACGLTMGARVAMGVAAQFPGRIVALIMVNAFLSLEPADKAARLNLYDELQHGEEGLKTWGLRLLAHMAIPEGSVIHRGFMRSLNTIDALHLRALLVESIELDQREEARRVGCPTLLVRGGQDDLVPLYCIQELHELIDQSTVEILQHCGHLPYLEAPDHFNDLIQKFVEVDALPLQKSRMG